ncbi:MAG: hypothetical protein IT292_05660 [Deltaproteobacteria bacterium]|nr:hypothetical protein [Deltaproteobacteria bacterium]
MICLARPLTVPETDRVAAIVVFMSGQSNVCVEQYSGLHDGEKTPIVGVFEEHLENITAEEIISHASTSGILLVTFHKVNFQDLSLFLKMLAFVDRLASSPVLTKHSIQIHRICNCREMSAHEIVALARHNGLFAIQKEMFT